MGSSDFWVIRKESAAANEQSDPPRWAQWVILILLLVHMRFNQNVQRVELIYLAVPLSFSNSALLKDIMVGRAVECYGGNILQCMKRHERKPRMQQWRLIQVKRK